MRKAKVGIVFAAFLMLISLIVLSGPVLTIYSQGIACVQDSFTLSLAGGVSDVEVPVPASIIPESALVSSVATVLSQSFAYTNTADLLSAAVGRKVEVMTSNGIYRGTLLAYNADTITMIDSSGTIRTIANPQQVSLGDQGVFALDPTLKLKVRSSAAGDVPATISYLTRDLSWDGSYICILDEDRSTISLNGQITLRNQCGHDFTGATVRFVAGDVNQVAPKYYDTMRAAPAPMAMETGASEQSAFEYHLYTLPGTIDLASGDSLVVPYTEGSDISVNKTYLYDGANGSGVQVKISFENSEDEGLGIPLPAGTVRLFGKADGALLFLGEDAIGHTAKDETVNLTVGSAFDIVGERTQLSRVKIATSTYRETYSIILRNHKDEDVSITVREHPNGTWNIVSSSQGYEKIDSNTIDFTLSVPAGGKSEVEYTVEYYY